MGQGGSTPAELQSSPEYVLAVLCDAGMPPRRCGCGPSSPLVWTTVGPMASASCCAHTTICMRPVNARLVSKVLREWGWVQERGSPPCLHGALGCQIQACLIYSLPSWDSHPTGWRGWGCTDSEDAPTYGFQLLSTLLLCLSNLMFLPPVVLAIRSRYVLEAAVYTFTMFFSTVRGGPCLV